MDSFDVFITQERKERKYVNVFIIHIALSSACLKDFEVMGLSERNDCGNFQCVVCLHLIFVICGSGTSTYDDKYRKANVYP